MVEYEVVIAGYDDTCIRACCGDESIMFGCDNFTVEELACPLTKRAKVEEHFIYMLQDLRDEVGHPMIVNSCCRSTQHNINVGGHPRSLHLMDNPAHPTKGTIAIDISTLGWAISKRDRFMMMAYTAGFCVGVGSTFIHLDARGLIDLPQTNWRYE